MKVSRLHLNSSKSLSGFCDNVKQNLNCFKGVSVDGENMDISHMNSFLLTCIIIRLVF